MKRKVIEDVGYGFNTSIWSLVSVYISMMFLFNSNVYDFMGVVKVETFSMFQFFIFIYAIFSLIEYFYYEDSKKYEVFKIVTNYSIVILSSYFYSLQFNWI